MAKALFLAVALLPQAIYSLSARLQRDTGNAAASGPVAGDQLEATSDSGSLSYSLYARRDGFTGERELLNAAALVYGNVRVEEHRFAFGLGSHYRQEKLARIRAGQGDFYPAVGFFWSHPQFRLDLAGSQYLTRVSLSGLLDFGFPVELNSDFESLHSQPYRWSANAFIFLSRYGGAIAGFEPLSQRMRAGIWLAPAKQLRVSALTRMGAGETFWEFGLSFQLTTEAPPHEQPPRYHAGATLPGEEPEQEQQQRQPRRPKNVPAFAVLVKWGLSPVEALKFTREKDACTLSEKSRRLLTAKNWGCRDA